VEFERIICRDADPADQKKIVEFQVSLAWESEQLKLDLGTCSMGVQEVFKNPHLGKYFVAERNSQLVGSLLIIPEWSDWRNGMVWWIHSVYVMPSERRNGVFSTLYRFIKTRGEEEQNIRGLRLFVDKTNIRAQQVYQKLGMTNHHYDLYECMRDAK